MPEAARAPALIHAPGTCAHGKTHRRRIIQRSQTMVSGWLFRVEVIDCDRVLEEGVVASNHRDTGLGDEVSLAVGLDVIADGGSFGDVNVAIQDRFANSTVAADVHM